MMGGRALRSVLLGAALVSAQSGCSSSTLDSLGRGSETSSPVPSALRPVAGPEKYLDVFGKDLLNKSDDEISRKITTAYQQLFHGTDAQKIFFEDQAGLGRSTIKDILHNDTRAEGMGLGLLIAVELNQKKDFDELWLYTKYGDQKTGDKKLFVPDGPAAGYFQSLCGEDAVTPCYDVYGMQLFALALMFANARWANVSPEMPYQSDALALLDVLKNKEAENGGIVGGIGSAFSPQDYLIREDPALADAGYTTRSSLQMPAAYSYWEKATGMPFWNSVAKASHTFLVKAAAPRTGLWPMRNYFDGTRVDGSAGFTQQAYRTQLNLAMDALWNTATPDQSELADDVANFFGEFLANGQSYGGTFDTDGSPILLNPAQALISVNGTLAVSAHSNNAYRRALAQAVWDQPIPTGDNRYYEGLMYLMSVLILSGQMQVY